MAAPKGNQNASKAKQWTAAIERAMSKRAGKGQSITDVLDEMAEKFLKTCDDGDLAAFKELGDRLEGKAAQSLSLDGSLDITQHEATLDDLK